MHCAHIVHLSAPLTLGNLVPQVRQRRLRIVFRNESFEPVLASAVATGAGELHHVGWIVFELQGTGYGMNLDLPAAQSARL
jgi:hypothetical protein